MSPENLLNLRNLIYIMIDLTIKITKIRYLKIRERKIMTLLIVGFRMDPIMRETVLQLITDRKINNLKDQDITQITMRTTHHLILSPNRIINT